MNYEPDITNYILTAEQKDTLKGLENFLRKELQYIKISEDLEFKRSDKDLWIYNSDNWAVITFLKGRGTKVLADIHKCNPEFIRLLELRSGPNHDYDNYPVFHAVELALYYYPGAHVLSPYSGQENSFISISAWQARYSHIAEMVLDSGCYALWTIQCAYRLFFRIKEIFPELFEDKRKKCVLLEKRLPPFDDLKRTI